MNTKKVFNEKMVLLAHQLNYPQKVNFKETSYEMNKLSVEEQEGVIYLSILLQDLEKFYGKK